MRSFIKLYVLFCALFFVSHVTKAQYLVQSGAIVSQGRCVDALRALQSENSDSVAVAHLYKYYVFSQGALPRLQPQQWRRSLDAIMADTTRCCVLKSDYYQQVLLQL